ncbi:MAG: peptidoglycan DD-metalloendopeptidase family protein [Cyanobacteriota bacterium]
MGQSRVWNRLNRFWQRRAGIPSAGLALLLLVLLLGSVGTRAIAQSVTQSVTQLGLQSRAIAPPALIAQASPSIDTLRQQRQQVEQKRSTLNQQRNQLENLENSAQQKLDALEDRINTTTAQIQQNEKKLKDANTRLAQLQADLAKAEERYQQQQFATVARLRFLQRQKDSSGWAVLLQSQNLNEFLEKRYQLRRVYQADNQFLVDLKRQSDELVARHRAVERQKNEIALLTQELQSQKAEYQQQALTQEELITRLKQDQQALEEAEEQLARDSASLANLIRQRLAAASRSRIVIRGNGIMSIPADGRLTSGFGYRVHPILGYRRFHAGIDFGAPTGTPIRAANNGVVIYSGWYGGYGRSVIVDHGNGITTLYAHASRVYVSEGQAVSRGEAIAAVGSTGFSTGPHLHFEVRKNGEPVDPLNYL